MPLEPEQLETLRALVEAANTVERARRRFYLSRGDGADYVHGPNGVSLVVLAEDLYDLASAGYLRPTQRFVTGDMEFMVSPEGVRLIEEIDRSEPMQVIEKEVTSRYFESDVFQERYSSAYARWSEAAALLWGPDQERELTTIGHKAREAVQEFATALLVRHDVTDAPDNPAHTVARLKLVIAAHRDRLGEARRHLLEALVVYWGEVIDLLQRQEHGGQKEGEALTWEDGRRAVFQTAIVMYEIDRTLD